MKFKQLHARSPIPFSEKYVWLSFKDFIKDFLGNTRAKNYTETVQKLLESYKMLGRIMSHKLHFMHCHLVDFSVRSAMSKGNDSIRI